MSDNTSINQYGPDSQTNINTGGGIIIINNGTLVRSMSDASMELRSWYSYIFADYHIDRAETQKILDWLDEWKPCEYNYDRVMLLVGDAGLGKSVVMRDVLVELENQGIKVLGLKSDILFSSDGNIDSLVGLGKPVSTVIKEFADNEKVVLLVDQIDALSSTLSSNRTPLIKLNSLIDEISKHHNVRVVVSCRPYDLRYDPSLERYSLGPVIHMNSLDQKDVDDTLKKAGIVIAQNEKVKEFLANPLNLFLFCRIKKANLFSSNRPNRTVLYEALWRQVMLEMVTGTDKVNTKTLENCLDYITSEMYSRQTLTLSEILVGNRFPHELTFLCSNNIINNKNGQVQFIHQSLYDYIYAKLFLTKNRTLDSIFTGIHQGLFIRLRLKQILFYLRDVDEDLYFSNLKELLFALNQEDKEKYRFHLKHLMVTNIGFLPSISEKEKKFIFDYILKDDSLREIFLDSIDKKAGLDVYIEWVDKQGGFCSIIESRQIQFLNACERVLFDDVQYVIEFILKLSITSLTLSVKQRLYRVVNNIPVTIDNVEQVKSLINTIYVDRKEMDFKYALYNVINIDAQFVADCIHSHIQALAKTVQEDTSAYDIRIDYDTEYLLDKLKKAKSELAFETILNSIEYLIRTNTMDESANTIIKTSSLFLTFRRKTCYPYGNFVENGLNYLMDEADKRAVGKPTEFAHKLQDLAQSDLAAFVLIATSAYTHNIDEYIDEAYALSKRIIESSHASAVLDHQAKEMFRILFPKLDVNRKNDIMDSLSRLNPEWETKKHTELKNPSRPMTYKDYTKAQYYNLLSEDEISNYPGAKKLLNEKLRAYQNLDNCEPFKVSSMSGYPAMDSWKYDSMCAKELVNSMLQITQDSSLDWSKPTKTGNALSMKQHVHERPEVYYDAYIQALDYADLDLFYPIYGVEAFIDCNYNRTELEKLVEKIISRFNPDLAKNEQGHVIQTCRMIGKYFEHGEVAPDVLFDFACKVTEKWDDSEYKTEANSTMSYNDGLNQVRGCAAEEILCYFMEKEKYDRIFDVLHKVADGAVSTRSIVLFKLGVLANAGRDRLKDLFLAMTHDYATSLLNLPIHKQNPLLYIINDYFSDLKPYFEACLANKDTHKINVVLLWIAWLRNIEDAEEMMYKMADDSEDARYSLLIAINDYYDKKYLSHILPIYERYMGYDESTTGGAYDLLFEKIETWPSELSSQFMNKFVSSKACRYCSRYFMKYLSITAKQQPHDCLRWIRAVYNCKKDIDDRSYSPSELIDILIVAYNSIHKFNKDDSDLENAMDMLDELLHKNVNRQHLFDCFKLLDN